MNKKLIYIIVLLVLISAIAYYFYSKNKLSISNVNFDTGEFYVNSPFGKEKYNINNMPIAGLELSVKKENSKYLLEIYDESGSGIKIASAYLQNKTTGKTTTSEVDFTEKSVTNNGTYDYDLSTQGY